MPKAKKKVTRKSAVSRKPNKVAKRAAPKLAPAKMSGVKGELKYIPWNTVELENMNPLLQRQLVVGQDIMVARVLMPLESTHRERLSAATMQDSIFSMQSMALLTATFL